MSITTAHITNYYHRNSGGISTSYNKLLEAANRHKRELILIVPGERTETERVGAFGKIYFIEAPHSPIFDKRYRLMLPWRAFMPDGSPVKSILRKEQPDLIEIGEKYTLSLMAGLLRKRLMNVAPERPLLVHSSCERMDDNVRVFLGGGRLGSWFSRLIVANYLEPMFDFHLSNSAYTQQEFPEARERVNRSGVGRYFSRLCHRIWNAPQIDLSDRSFINECGADLKIFSPARKSENSRISIANSYGLDPDKRWLLYVGRLSPEKNLGLLLDTVKKLMQRNRSEYQFLIIGSGPESDRFINKARSISAEAFCFPGQIADKEQLADIYANCDIFVHPNPREPFGIAPLEAMASGLPLVAPNAGGVLSYANQQNSWLALPNGKDFADAIAQVTEERTIRKNKIEAALNQAEQYSWEASTDARFKAYDHMYEIYMTNRSSFGYIAEPIGIDYSV